VIAGLASPDELEKMDKLVKTMVGMIRDRGEGQVSDGVINEVISKVINDLLDEEEKLDPPDYITQTDFDTYIEQGAQDLGYYYVKNNAPAQTLVLMRNNSLRNIVPPVDIDFTNTLDQHKATHGFYHPKSVVDFKYSQAIVDPNLASFVDDEVKPFNRKQELTALAGSNLRNSYIGSGRYRQILDELRKNLTDESGQLNDAGQDFINSWSKRLTEKPILPKV
jgi:hypothetical protein